MGETRLSMRSTSAALRKFWWVVVLAAIVSTAVTYGYGLMQVPKYRSTATLYFALPQGTSASDLYQGSAYTQSQMLSFAQLTTSSTVLEPVIDELNLEEPPRRLARSIEVSIPQDTVTLRVTAVAESAGEAADLANSVAKQLILVIQDVAPKTPEGASTITAHVIDHAVPPAFQFTPDKTRDALLGGFIGGLVGLAAVLLIGLLDTRLRTREVLAQAGGEPVLGVISKSALLATGGIAVAREPSGETAEEFRRVGSALTYANVKSRAGVLLFTSATPAEGKSTIALNLAMTLAALQHSVLFVDADLRQPSAQEVSGVDGSTGLSTLLLDEDESMEGGVAKHRVRDTTLHMLPSGELPADPGRLLTSDRMAQLIETASAKYEFVVLDSPPTLSVADAGLLAPLVDGVVLVVDARTKRATLTESMRLLESSGAQILGTVLNRARP